MISRKIVYIACLLSVIATPAYASDTKPFYACSHAIEINSSDTYPGANSVSTSNNLRHQPGEIHIAEGKQIFLTGNIVDENCVPVAGARVQVWHANARGYFQNDLTPTKHIDPYFAGSGETHSNNRGEYGFITILPGRIDEETLPFINISASHPELGIIRTRVYLPTKDQASFKAKTSDSSSNSDDDTLPPDALKEINAAELSGRYNALLADVSYHKNIPTYSFNISLPTAQSFRKY